MSASEPTVLGIETSCDETAAAVVRGDTIISSVVASQDAVHSRFGGVVPELASRHHLLNVIPVVDGALVAAGLTLSGLDALAVTRGPGLVGALLVGVQLAKGLAFARQKPLVGVNHLEGHLIAAHLQRSGQPATPTPEYPYVALLVSGGHTAVYDVKAFGEYRTLGETRDDAAGEAFDKVAKLLGLGYPGGATVEREARKGDPGAVRLPKVMPGQSTFDMSFSGLKTAVAQWLRDHPGALVEGPAGDQARADVCAAFQGAVLEVLTRRTEQAMKLCRRRQVVLAGGVAANGALRNALGALTQKLGAQLFVPARDLCTDNAAMIAGAGALRFAKGERDGLRLNAIAQLPL